MLLIIEEQVDMLLYSNFGLRHKWAFDLHVGCPNLLFH